MKGGDALISSHFYDRLKSRAEMVFKGHLRSTARLFGYWRTFKTLSISLLFRASSARIRLYTGMINLGVCFSNKLTRSIPINRRQNVSLLTEKEPWTPSLEIFRDRNLLPFCFKCVVSLNCVLIELLKIVIKLPFCLLFLPIILEA